MVRQTKMDETDVAERERERERTRGREREAEREGEREGEIDRDKTALYQVEDKDRPPQ